MAITGNFISNALQSWTGLNFSGFIFPLLTYAFLLAIYTAFVWHFYKSIGKRDLFDLRFDDGHAVKSSVVYVLKYLVSFPVLTFLWFAGLSIVLFLLAKSQPTDNILLLSMGVVAAARATSYYKQEAAEELAKILPLGVMAIFIVDPTYFSIDLTLSRFAEVPTLVVLLLNYLFFTVIMEFTLRILFLIKRAVADGHDHPKHAEKKGKKIKEKK